MDRPARTTAATTSAAASAPTGTKARDAKRDGGLQWPVEHRGASGHRRSHPATSGEEAQIVRERQKDGGHELDKAGVAQQVQELTAQAPLDVLDVKRFERAIVRRLKEDLDRHERSTGRILPCRKRRRPPPGKQFLLPARRKLLPQSVHRAEQRESTHGRTLLALDTLADVP